MIKHVRFCNFPRQQIRNQREKKTGKYQDLAISKVKKQWKTTIIPVAAGAFGTTLKMLPKRLKILESRLALLICRKVKS